MRSRSPQALRGLTCSYSYRDTVLGTGEMMAQCDLVDIYGQLKEIDLKDFHSLQQKKIYTCVKAGL